jgi:hypothetical protein
MVRWLRKDLANRSRKCTLAYFHHPLFSSGQFGDQKMKASWRALYAENADVVLSGHDHHYERFAPQTPSGQLDRSHGIRQFVVGTGGRQFHPFVEIKPNSEVQDASTYGVLKLTLRSSGYGWEFVPAAGGTFTDTGSGDCH